MAAPARPLVSVVIVNFNGERYLENLLTSLERQSYPDFEILLVDNASTDGSVPLVERDFPGVRLIRAKGNLGFAEGNNVGIRASRGDFIALINNDTVVEDAWLATLVEDALSSTDIGAVGSKILFARPFIPVTVSSETFCPARNGIGTDGRELGVIVSENSHFRRCTYQKVIFQTGFYGPEIIEGKRGRWSKARATLLLPVETIGEPGDLNLILHRGQSPRTGRVGVEIGETSMADLDVGQDWKNFTVSVPGDLIASASTDVINNAGSFLEKDGRAGDRGIYEADHGTYDAAEDVSALCGCSMLISRAALDRVGLLDRDFFMYYEDTEMCWRLRKAGYRLRYQPASVVRHIHAATSGEWSPTFSYLVGRNRVLMLLKHAPVGNAVWAYLEEVYRLLVTLRQQRSLKAVDVRTRLKIQLSLLYLAPRAVMKRFGLLSH